VILYLTSAPSLHSAFPQARERGGMEKKRKEREDMKAGRQEGRKEGKNGGISTDDGGHGC